MKNSKFIWKLMRRKNADRFFFERIFSLNLAEKAVRKYFYR